jgi:hypothetical protein
LVPLFTKSGDREKRKMAKDATVEMTDNDGYIVRTYGAFDDDGKRTEKPRIEVVTTLDDVPKVLKKFFDKKAD